MIALRCTRKILDRLGVEPVEPTGTPTNVLGDWYVNLLRVGPEQIVLATSERSFLSVVLPARDLRQTLVSGLCTATFERLQQIGIDRDRAQREVAAMQPIVFARTSSRSVLGAMNDIAREVRYLRGEGRDLSRIVRQLDEMPMFTSGSRYNEALFPGAKTVKLLTGRTIKGVRLLRLDC